MGSLPPPVGWGPLRSPEVRNMTIQLLDHIGIVVWDMQFTLRQYETVLGLKPTHIETYGDGLLDIAFLPVGSGSEFGWTKLELLQPLRPGTSAWEFLHQHGQGVAHGPSPNSHTIPP